MAPANPGVPFFSIGGGWRIWGAPRRKEFTLCFNFTRGGRSGGEGRGVRQREASYGQESAAEKGSLFAGSSQPPGMKPQLSSPSQPRRVHSGATSWFLGAQTVPTPASPPPGDTIRGAQPPRAPPPGSQRGQNPGPRPSTSTGTLFLPLLLRSLLFSPK